MKLAIAKLISKLDDSPVVSKHQYKDAILKRKDPHVGLYVETENQHTWVFWITKPEQRLLREAGARDQ